MRGPPNRRIAWMGNHSSELLGCWAAAVIARVDALDGQSRAASCSALIASEMQRGAAHGIAWHGKARPGHAMQTWRPDLGTRRDRVIGIRKLSCGSHGAFVGSVTASMQRAAKASQFAPTPLARRHVWQRQSRSSPNVAPRRNCRGRSPPGDGAHIIHAHARRTCRPRRPTACSPA
jgi:hypothetical protein